MIVFAGLLGFCGCGGPHSNSPSPEEQTFSSYVNATYGLAIALQRIQSAEEANNPTNKAGIDRQLVQLSNMRQAVQMLPEETRLRLCALHSDRMGQTASACEALAERHKANPEIMGQDWERYREALQFGDLAAP